jgi:hypothetical protein
MELPQNLSNSFSFINNNNNVPSKNVIQKSFTEIPNSLMKQSFLKTKQSILDKPIIKKKSKVIFI